MYLRLSWLVILSAPLLIAFEQAADLGPIRKLIASGAVDQAAASLRTIVGRDPSNADARLLLGSALAVKGDRSEALSQLLEAVRLRPNSAPAYHTLGMALSRFAELDQARQAFEKALELDPKLADANVHLALVHAQSGNLDKAEVCATRAIALSSGPYAYYVRARIYTDKEEHARAAADFQRAIDLRPNYAEAWLGLGLARRALQDQRGSLTALERAVRLGPGSVQARYALGREYLTAGKATLAIEQLREARRLDPRDTATVYNLARALRAAGQVEEAKRLEQENRSILRADYESSQSSPEATRLNNEGVALEKDGNLPAALAKYRAAVELLPTHTGIRLNAALALCRLGRWDEGITELEEILRFEPDNEKAVRALYIARENAPRPQPNR